jgi:hypothetical protein
VNHFHEARSANLLTWSQRFFFAIAIAALAPYGYGQVAPAEEGQQPGTTASLDEASSYPVQSQIAETPNLNSLNENADTDKYSDNALTRGPLFFSVEATGTGTTNLEAVYDNQPSTSGAYFTVATPIGIHLRTPVTNLGANFRYETSIYPGHSDLNHSSEIYTHQLTHHFSDTTTGSWALAGGHVVYLGQYLSSVIGVGTTGVVAPQEATGLQPSSNAATTFSISHQTSERNSWTAAGTAGWLDSPTLGVTPGSGTTSLREATGGGDFQWQRALNPREIAGVELTNVYIKGLSPSGMSNFTSAKLTFGQTLTPYTSVTVGLGPLYSNSNLAGSPTQSNLSYTANVGFDYRRVFAHISGGYSRVYDIGYLASTSVAHELYFAFNRRLTSKISLLADSQYLRNSAQRSTAAYSTFGFTTRLDMYLTPSLVYHVAGSSFIRENVAGNPGNRNNTVSSGFTFYFGSPLSRAGAQQ